MASVTALSNRKRQRRATPTTSARHPMRRIALLIITTILALWVAPPVALERWFGEPVMLTIRAASRAAFAWLMIATVSAGMGAVSLGWELARRRSGHSGRRGLWLLGIAGLALLTVGVPAAVGNADAYQPPMVTLVTTQWSTAIWFVCALVGTLLLLIVLGSRLHGVLRHRQRAQQVQMLVKQQIEEGIALLDRNLQVQWHNEVARRHIMIGDIIESDVIQLARRARDMGKVTAQGMTFEEDRIIIQALPLPDGDTAIVTRPQPGEKNTSADFYERFMRRIVHDMRNPLAAIIAHASNLQTTNGFDPPTARRTAQTIETEAQRLTRLVDGILFDARLSHVPLVLQRIDLRDILEEVYFQHDERAEREGKTLEFEIPAEVMLMDGDRDLLVRALANLVDNALKYSPAGASVRILGEIAPEHHIVRIIDDGDGIPPEYLPDRIFEALVRVKPRDGVTGSGLGLNIVRKIAQMHGGTITAESQLGAGTTMTLVLPRSI